MRDVCCGAQIVRQGSIVSRLAGVQVLVATAPMCWGMTAAAALVVIMGTQYYDASGATSGADYSVTDLLQMMGRASRPDIDEVGRSAAARPTATLLRCLHLMSLTHSCGGVCALQK